MEMKKRTKGSLGIALATVVSIAFFALSHAAVAATDVVSIEGMKYSVSKSMADNLKSFIGKKISVTTSSGQTYSGVVKNVSSHLVHLEKLQGKDYFDALIRVEDINAVEARFWEYKR